MTQKCRSWDGGKWPRRQAACTYALHVHSLPREADILCQSEPFVRRDNETSKWGAPFMTNIPPPPLHEYILHCVLPLGV
jgi:hypothetical protein